MLEMIEERKTSTGLDEKRDLMSNWIHASMGADRSGGKEPTLTEREILGNIFTFLVAGGVAIVPFIYITFETDLGEKGHETTAYSLASALALLSLYQDEQDELYEHVRSVVPEGRLPVRYCQMCFMLYSLAFLDISRCSTPHSSYCRHFRDPPALSTCK